MVLIRDVVQQVLLARFLSVETEEQLRQLLKSKYDWKDQHAFLTLQRAVMEGYVRQETCDLRRKAGN